MSRSLLVTMTFAFGLASGAAKAQGLDLADPAPAADAGKKVCEEPKSEYQKKKDAAADALLEKLKKQASPDFKQQAARRADVPGLDGKVRDVHIQRANDNIAYLNGEAWIGEITDLTQLNRWNEASKILQAHAVAGEIVGNVYDAHFTALEGAIDNNDVGAAQIHAYVLKALAEPFPDNYPNYTAAHFACAANLARIAPDNYKPHAINAAKYVRDNVAYKFAVGDAALVLWHRKETARAMAEAKDFPLAVFNAVVADCLKVD